MKLADWIDAEGIKRYEAAERFNMAKSYLTEICKGKRKPSLAVSARIYKATGGQVDLLADMVNGVVYAEDDIYISPSSLPPTEATDE